MIEGKYYCSWKLYMNQKGNENCAKNFIPTMPPAKSVLLQIGIFNGKSQQSIKYINYLHVLSNITNTANSRVEKKRRRGLKVQPMKGTEKINLLGPM
jgi:hypothetical protein